MFSTQELVVQLDHQVAMLKAKRAATDENPIINAMDRAHAQGGELALMEFKLWVMEHSLGRKEVRA